MAYAGTMTFHRNMFGDYQDLALQADNWRSHVAALMLSCCPIGTRSGRYPVVRDTLDRAQGARRGQRLHFQQRDGRRSAPRRGQLLGWHPQDF